MLKEPGKETHACNYSTPGGLGRRIMNSSPTWVTQQLSKNLSQKQTKKKFKGQQCSSVQWYCVQSPVLREKNKAQNPKRKIKKSRNDEQNKCINKKKTWTETKTLQLKSTITEMKTSSRGPNVGEPTRERQDNWNSGKMRIFLVWRKVNRA